ncbi:hypothetical protein PGTUg99_030253 [Puccinia graminis f. sp. tritici]|uniref:Uncharacterized protein n=1 Tax=Puccinia graminis f. sp. tritici TaxID=56615 RepID=A0A5B0RNJ7_PUCGR|nr:hypothetical protein PGTUg99_030253 [Puccinia graminis f. sp. tritici]
MTQLIATTKHFLRRRLVEHFTLSEVYLVWDARQGAEKQIIDSSGGRLFLCLGQPLGIDSPQLNINTASDTPTSPFPSYLPSHILPPHSYQSHPSDLYFNLFRLSSFIKHHPPPFPIFFLSSLPFPCFYLPPCLSSSHPNSPSFFLLHTRTLHGHHGRSEHCLKQSQQPNPHHLDPECFKRIDFSTTRWWLNT